MDVEGPRGALWSTARFGARLVGVLFGLALVASCAGPDPSDSGDAPTLGQRYVDSQVGFSITPPADWQTRPTPATNPVVTFVRTPADPAGPVTIIVFVSGTDEGLDANITAARQQLPQLLPNYRSLTDESTQLSDGTPAHLLGGSYTQNGAELRNLQMVAVVGGTSYVATATGPSTSFDDYRDVVHSSLLTLSPRIG
ncbi:LpqN/LpqT family lipoprotein [Pseudonocardia spinosispora]|uniref:LpqN/LpqT family lipoprotein n=1 Tax=Pseudonocardia spinosispora TaxID=103441 RepID=UPI0004282775|nr:LpqN/LpqT family lipoprotein [Pseudonocardia spinosispora]